MFDKNRAAPIPSGPGKVAQGPPGPDPWPVEAYQGTDPWRVTLTDPTGSAVGSPEQNNTISVSVESREIVMYLQRIDATLRLIAKQLEHITDEVDPL